MQRLLAAGRQLWGRNPSGGCSDCLGCKGCSAGALRRLCLGTAATACAAGHPQGSDCEGAWGARLRVRAAATVRAPGTCSDCEGRRFRVVASSSRRGWQQLRGNIYCGSVATLRWQHLVRRGGNISVATFRPCPPRRRDVVVAASSSLRRRVVVVVVASSRRRPLYRYPHPSSWVRSEGEQ